MIHNVSGGISGSVQEVEAYAETLRKFNDQIANFYATVTGIDLEEINTMMLNETWLTAQEAVDMKFVSKIHSEVSGVTNVIDPQKWSFKNMEVLTAYNNFSNKINMENQTISAIVNGVKDAFMNALIKAKLVPAEASEIGTTITNALNEALAPMNAGINDMVTEVLNERLATMQAEISTMISNAVAQIEIPANEVVSLEPLEQRLTEIENALADGAGSAGSRNDGGQGATNATNHKGIAWGRPTE